ncbi:MAG: V-type ATP synthase subunit A [Fibrobacterota bacterium]
MSTTGKVTGIIANLVSIETNGPVAQNEICFIRHSDGARLMAEVIRITGATASVQVFESTRGLKAGDTAEFTGRMLEVTLGPGLLKKNFDGLQNDLDKMTGVYLERGQYTAALDEAVLWDFKPLKKARDRVFSADWLGGVQEGWIDHKIMVPFGFAGAGVLRSIVPAGRYTVRDTVAVIADESGTEHTLTMAMRWPVKVEVRAYKNKPRPFRVLETGVRVIDTLNPIAEGGTGFIPGPFGSGKTVLQHALSKYADADLIIIVACGERANEVVEIFTEFPHLDDPRTGRKLMERTIIICNTSNMPVASREASVYTGMTLAEYYRMMGLKVLLLADSTSRWAQALREMSNRMEELPGPDAFPMDLTAIISSFYARAGIVELKNGRTGSITFIGTVSPAGGNLKEPVTEATKKSARCFYALSQARADSKRYPAIDPIESYSKYLEYDEVARNLDATMGGGWVAKVVRLKDLLHRGKEARDQIGILGDDSVPLDYHFIFNKAELIDFVLLQQDAFDKIDASTPLPRQRYMVDKVLALCGAQYRFDHFEGISPYFKKLINLLRQMNYQEFQGENFLSLERDLDALFAEGCKAPENPDEERIGRALEEKGAEE